MDDLVGRLLRRDRDAVSPALNLVDDRRPGPRRRAAAMLAALEEAQGEAGGARRVGLTGAPGAGKSMLLDLLVRRLRAGGATVGAIAVDPSSRVSGGALLGDRLRVRASAGDPGVFFRSLAAREQLGGLAVEARAAVLVLASVFDVVLVETVGVGQSESEVAELVDTLVYVAQPGAGDLLQFMKAGLLELPDVFAVNKADLGAPAERTASELEAGLGLGEAHGDGWKPPVILVSAREGTGADALLAALDTHREHLAESGALAARRLRGRDAFVRDTLRARYGSFGLEAVGGPEALAARLRGAASAPGFALVEALGREIAEALREGKRETDA